MPQTDADKLKGNFNVYSNGEYVVISGKKLYIFRTDGSQVACRSDLRYAGRITFLSGNRMLLCSSKAVFHMINLRDGNDIWTAPYRKNEFNIARLAISPNEVFAYTFDQWRGTDFISRLDLQTHDVDVHKIHKDMGATRDIVCDEKGRPCLLKTRIGRVGGSSVQHVSIQPHDFGEPVPENTAYWQAKGYLKGRNALHFLDSPNRVITEDLCIYDVTTGSLVDLLENDLSCRRLEQFPVRAWLDNSGRYLCVQYQTVNVIIDTQERKTVAQYAADQGKGCLIGDAYWICSNSSLCRKPFPAFEEAPPVKIVFDWGSDYSKHPELW